MGTPAPRVRIGGMTFSLKTLLLVAAVAPPVAWLLFSALPSSDPEKQTKFPDPILMFGVVAWISIYYNMVHKQLPDRT